MSSPARWGVLLPSFDPLRSGRLAQTPQAALLAEQLGFDAAWAGDHLHCPAPVLDAPSVLAAAAAVTERIQLGLSVMLIGLRPPAWAAKQLSTVEVLSGGRLLLGVGVGGEFPDEFRMAGVSLADRGARTDETLEVLGEMLCGEPVHHRGASITLDAPALQPALDRPPPLYIGGRSEAAMRRAARFGDLWLPMWLSPRAIEDARPRLAALADEHGRRRPGIALLVGVHVDRSRARARRQAAAFINGQYRMGIDAVERWSVLGDAAEVAGQLQALLAAGAQELVLMPLADDALQQYERLADTRRLLETSALQEACT